LPLALLVLVPAVRAASQSVWRQEEAAQKRLKVDARGVTVKSLLDAIGAASGMRLEARRDVAGLKAAVFAKDAAAGELLDALAALFGASWRRVEDPQGARYVLDLEPTTRSLIARRHEALLAAQMQSLEAYAAALGWPEERLATLPESDPIRQYLSQPASRAGLAFYAALSANERSRLWSRRRLSLPFRALPPLQQQTALAIARHIADSAAARPPTAGRQGMSQELDPEALQRGSVQLRLRTLAGQRMLFLTLPNGGIPVALAHLAPASPYHVSGNPYNAATGPLTAPADTAKPAERALLLSDAFEAARALAEGTGRPVLRDFYRFARTPPPAQDSITNPPESPLDRLAVRSHATWWLSGSALLFRSHDWHLLDLREPSDESLVRVARLMPRPPDRLSIGALQEYARLPLEQITGVNRRVNSLADESLYDGLPELIALMAAMPGIQERLAASEPVEMAIGALPAGAQASLLRFAEAVGEVAPLTREDRLRLQAQVTPFPPRSAGDPAMARVAIQWGVGRSAGAFTFFMPTSPEQLEPPPIHLERLP
jgi:hypothetical protein